MELGEYIELSGFSDEAAEIIIIKKLVGNHVKHITESLPGFERLVLTHKEVHSNHEIQGKLSIDGNDYYSKATEHNMFFALDACLKKLASQARK